MEINNLTNFINGWIIGNFQPSLFETEMFEIAIKRYNRNEYEKTHHHKIATEYTIIVEGEVEMNGTLYKKNDIIKILKNESTYFKCLTDVITVVIKTPSVINDKYIN